MCLEIALTLLFLGGVGYHCSKRCRDSATLIAKMLSVAFLKYSYFWKIKDTCHEETRV